MRFIRSQFTNFRNLSDFQLRFSDDPKKPLTIIRGEPESGKTTLFSALQWVIWGKTGLKNDRQEIHHYDEANPSLSAHEVKVDGELTFRDSLVLDNGSIKSTDYTIRRTQIVNMDPKNSSKPWNFGAESLALWEHTPEGHEQDHGGQTKINSIMNPEIQNVSFVDGDDILDFINSENISSRRKKVEEALKEILDMKLVDLSITHLSDVNKASNALIKDSGNDETLASVSNRINILQTEMENLKEVIKKHEDQISHDDDKISELEEQLLKSNAHGDPSEIQKSISSVKKTISHQEQQDTNWATVLSGEFTENEDLTSFLLSTPIKKASAKLEELKRLGQIPKSTVPYLQSILGDGRCLCGETLTPDCRHYMELEKLIEESSRSEDANDFLLSLRNTAKTYVNSASDSISNWSQRYVNYNKNRRDVQDSLDDLRGQLKSLEEQLKKIPGTEIQEIVAMIGKYKTSRDEALMSLGKSKQQLQQNSSELKDKQSEQIVLLKKKGNAETILNRMTAGNDLQNILMGTLDRVENFEVPQVSKKMNDLFTDLIGANPEHSPIARVEVASDYEIRAYGVANQKLNNRLINGASLRALTAAFILAMFKTAGVYSPIIIDTPLGMAGQFVKQRIVHQLIDNTDQTILFLTRGEINDIQEMLDEYAGEVYTLTLAAHYSESKSNTPGYLANDPGAPYRQTRMCHCNHRQYCDLCEYVSDNENPLLKQRQMET